MVTPGTYTLPLNARLVAVAHDDRLGGQLMEWWLFRGDEYIVVMSGTIDHSGLQDDWIAETAEEAKRLAREILEELS